MSEPSAQELEPDARAYDRRLLRRLVGYLRPYRPQVALALVLLFVGAGLELAGPYLTKVALDRAIPDGDARLLGWLVAAYAGSLVLGFLAEYADTLLTTWLGQRVMFDMRAEVFTHLQRLSLRYFDRNPVGRLMTRVTNDVEQLNEAFSSGLVTVFGDVFTLIFILGMMLQLNWRLALVTFTVLPLVAVATFVFRGLIRTAYRDIRVRLARINAFMQEQVSGMRVVQLFGRQEPTLRRFKQINDDHLQAHLRSITYYALFFPTIEVLTAVALALILWYGGGETIQGTMTLGVVAAFLQYTRRFFRPIQDLSEKYNILQGAMAASERIFELLDTTPEVADDADPLRLPVPGRGEIEFRDVWFRYDDDGEWVLRGVSFVARPGERVAIVGATGAGKSTIISLLMRFYDTTRGEVLFDGVPVRRVPMAELRARVSLVLQDVFLFSQDVSSNIRLGAAEISDEQVRAAAARVGADRVVQRLPGGYDQPLGERGLSLSVGERQLVSFARALAFDPQVLVLDEATSSVDSELEAQIQEALDELMRGRTSLVIAHRLSTVVSADQILVLHQGEVRERGTHAELLRRGGLYARLYELQFIRQSAAGDAAAD
ncbi:ABC transporter ATP-binding protein [Longimicrobium terrae]|uniref:ATP-binding cassette subfamily B protein n=1 Tax=Longimicrobium terrae TaxID=1639882 RepID=A0A841H1A8_9BACT|nr:ABC transporter ATP-binding protein [Longimicrobium terrae]MBB4637338.1 ATP-binding cassette subfamily B protein [Longimicrobium terrae]MBB6071736.1 ATP-binding cassette subfamily B protein [Longimicrobium terrae]NNC28497.1 ABC transporter ATP-binding protein [Longimicrobium terrae]